MNASNLSQIDAQSFDELVTKFNAGSWRQTNDDCVVFPDRLTAAVWMVNSGQFSDGAWEDYEWAYGGKRDGWTRWISLSVRVDEEKSEIRFESRKHFDDLDYESSMLEFDSRVGSDVVRVRAVLNEDISVDDYVDAVRAIERGIHAAKGDRFNGAGKHD